MDEAAVDALLAYIKCLEDAFAIPFRPVLLDLLYLLETT